MGTRVHVLSLANHAEHLQTLIVPGAQKLGSGMCLWKGRLCVADASQERMDEEAKLFMLACAPE